MHHIFHEFSTACFSQIQTYTAACFGTAVPSSGLCADLEY